MGFFYSMAADVSSPGFAFRVVRQAEKQAELGNRNYPTGVKFTHC